MFVEDGKQVMALYFLNKLPSDLVEIVVPEREMIKSETVSENTAPATLPDFDFD